MEPRLSITLSYEWGHSGSDALTSGRDLRQGKRKFPLILSPDEQLQKNRIGDVQSRELR